MSSVLCVYVCVRVRVRVCVWCDSPQDFDKLMEAMKSTLAEDSHSAFVFNCSNGKGRTTTAMVMAALTLWHFNVRGCLEHNIELEEDSEEI